jgi:hypothetical protein
MKTPSQRDRVRQQFLNIVRDEVETRLQQCLHNQIANIDPANRYLFGSKRNISEIQLHWNLKLRFGSQPVKLQSETTLFDIFNRDDICGRFAIVGRMGSGRTTELLKLTKKLIERAQVNPKTAIPVLISVSVERYEQESLQYCIVEQIKQKYGLRRDICQSWLNAGLIFPVLEKLILPNFMLERQQDFRQNSILQEDSQSSFWQFPFLVCCTNQEYAYYQTFLNLNGCVEIQPLSEQQIQDYLQKHECQHLWNAIQNDESFMRDNPYELGLAKIPLFLNIAIAASSQINFQYWQQLSSETERIDYLLSIYIEKFANIDSNGDDRPSQAKTIYWLGWLADKLYKESKMEISIDEIQPYWLENYKQKFLYLYKLYFMGGNLIFLLFILPALISIFLFTDGFICLIILYTILVTSTSFLLAIIVVLTLKNLEDRVENYIPEILKITISDPILFSPKEDKKFLQFIIVGAVFVFVFGIFSKPGFGFILGSLFAVFRITISTKNSNSKSCKTLNSRKLKNPVLQRFVYNFLMIVTLAFPLALMFYIGLYLIQLQDYLRPVQDLNLLLIVATSIGIMATIGIVHSGGPTLKHFVLRLVLWWHGYIPWNYAAFLDYASDRLLLQRVGGGYRFLHEYLRNYFAKMYRQNYTDNT